MNIHKRILTSTALVLALSAPAFAQTGTNTENTQPPAAMEQPAEQGNDTMNQSTEMDSETPAVNDTASDETTAPRMDSASDDTMEPKVGPTTAASDPDMLKDDGLPSEPILLTQAPDQMISDDIIGMDVRNSEDESIGSIDALVIDDENRVVAGIVSVGGFLGIGAKDVAVNWREFTFQPEEEVAMVSLSREQLETAPKFREREDVQAQLRVEEQRQEIEMQQDKLEEQAESPVADGQEAAQ